MLLAKTGHIFRNLNNFTIKKPSSVKIVFLKYLSTTKILSTSVSVEQADSYNKDGFFVVRKLISEEKLERFKERFQKICLEKIRVPAMTVMKDVAIAKSEFSHGEKAITKIQDFCYDDELFEYCRLPELVKYVQGITGPNAMAMHTMLINKPPGIIKH
jgi:phytanoyl-CoA hydroxylase